MWGHNTYFTHFAVTEILTKCQARTALCVETSGVRNAKRGLENRYYVPNARMHGLVNIYGGAN